MKGEPPMKALRTFYAQHKHKIMVALALTMLMTLCLATGVSATSTGGLENVGTVAEFLWGQIADVVTTIVSTPLLLIPVGIFVAGAAIGLAKRFIGR